MLFATETIYALNYIPRVLEGKVFERVEFACFGKDDITHIRQMRTTTELMLFSSGHCNMFNPSTLPFGLIEILYLKNVPMAAAFCMSFRNDR